MLSYEIKSKELFDNKTVLKLLAIGIFKRTFWKAAACYKIKMQLTVRQF
jgi:hypothetical protein